VFFKLSEKQPIVLSKQPIVLYLGVLRKVENCFWWLTCQTKTIDCFGTITKNCFVLWLSFKWFYNWIRSSFKCFDQSLKAINSLFSLCNKQEERFEFLNYTEKQIWVFTVFCYLKSWSVLWFCFWSRKWNRIFILYWFHIHFVKSVILLYFC